MITANHTQDFFTGMPGGVDITGPGSKNSLQIFWPGGRGLISPIGTLLGGSTISFTFLTEGDYNNTPFKVFTASDPIWAFDFWRPRGYIMMSVTSPEGDSANGVNGQLTALERAG
jgi:hypothetical protein